MQKENNCGVHHPAGSAINGSDNRSNACTEYGTGMFGVQKFRELSNCDEIRAFSDDTARLFKRAYPMYNHVIPHAPHYLPAVKNKKFTETLTLVLSAYSATKRLEVVKALAGYNIEELNICLRLIGTSDEEIESPVFSRQEDIQERRS